MNRLGMAVLLSLGVLLCSGAGWTQVKKYTPVGMGGGGAMYEPASSPHDPKLMFVSCDMSGFYRTEDGGASWQMIDFRQTKGNTRCPPIFHPRKPNVVYFSGKISRDAGKTWKPIVTPTPWRGRIQQMGIGRDGRVILVGLTDGAWISRDEGNSWSRCRGVKGTVVGLFVGPYDERRKDKPPSRLVFIGTRDGIYRGHDVNETWVKLTNGLPKREIRSFTGTSWVIRYGHPPMGARTWRPSYPIRLYCTVPSWNENGRFAGGIYTMMDGDAAWRSAMGKGLNTRLGRIDQWGSGEIPQYGRIAAAPGRRTPWSSVAYVACAGTGYWPPHQDTVYRTDDDGRTWRPVQFYDFRFTEKRAADYKGLREMNFAHGWIPYTITWIWGGLPGRSGLHVNATNPDVIMATNGGELFVTTDGGHLWRQRYTAYSPGQEPPVPTPKVRPGRWQSIGLEVTTTWNYRIDPFDHKRHFICYTDIGLMRSEDAGKTWTDSNAGSPWRGNTYDIVFDPARKGRVWAAQSGVHDIPHWTYVHEEVKGPGGVCVSDDGGVTWKESTDGLPKAPATSIVLEPTSAVGNRTLYVSLYNHGVYRSVDDGKTWRAVNNGIDLKTNAHSWLLKRHPNGTLYCCVTATRGPGRRGNTYPRPGALYKSTDMGESWTNILASRKLYWPGELAVHPTNPDVIYLAVHTATRRENGGVYSTTDGGKTWTRHLANEDFRGKGGPNWATPLFVTMDPDNPDTVYVGTDGHGLWISRDRAKTWSQLEGLPFGNIHRITFDPDSRDKVYITTFGGGVWVGPRP